LLLLGVAEAEVTQGTTGVLGLEVLEDTGAMSLVNRLVAVLRLSHK